MTYLRRSQVLIVADRRNDREGDRRREDRKVLDRLRGY